MLINVLLIGATEHSQMDDSLLKQRITTIDDEREHTVVTEYWVDFADERAVHRSVHVHCKQAPSLFAAAGDING